MLPDGSLIRLFPVPFRLIDGSQQFKKWQWVRARIDRARADRRPESHKLFVDTVRFLGEPLPTAAKWKARREWTDKFKVFDDFANLDAHRASAGTTLGIVRPRTVGSIEITPVAHPEWTNEERAKLLQSQHQGGLFDETDAKTLTTLRKLPFDFHYHYVCTVGGVDREYRHKIVDWEAGALYWNCFFRHGSAWEKPFRDQLAVKLPAADLMFLMGTIHRFPEQWLIVSLIYPPRRPIEQTDQPSLFDL
ncbi:hypothetical protein ACFQX9_30120 [Bradyrhizobium sp. GCM10028915]|uniref:hypothetical protein n=1 Tax=Bradyrhizobium sp. GCM10028915 TaxID=3273385 RepID=UPI00360D9AC8